LAADRKIVLHAGSLAPWTGAAEMVRATAFWPDDWLLVCHTRRRPNPALDTFIAELRALAPPGRVVFSTDPVAHSEYPALIESADAALAYYLPMPGSPFTQDNLRCLGLSAGKVAYALQAGVPLVAADHPTLRRLIADYACGEIAADPADNRSAIERVLGQRDRYGAAAVRCFEQEFDFRGRFARVLGRLDALPAHGRDPARTNNSPQ
jgi:glycosyltransferase involved in cell wall biosynthesis